MRTLMRIAAMFVFLVMITFLLVAEPLEIKGVRITGVHSAPREQIESIASTLIGQNIFRARTGLVERQLLSLLEVRSASVRRAADLKVDVVIVEREPFVALRPPMLGPAWEDQAGIATVGGYLLVDREGLIYRDADTLPPDVPVVECEGLPFVPLGSRLPGRVMDDLHKCLKCLKTVSLPLPAEMVYSWVGSISLRFADGLLIRLGHDDWCAKLRYAKRALEQIHAHGQEASSLDLRSLEAPIWTPKNRSTLP